MQKGFIADLTKAQLAVESAYQRATASEKRALLEIEKERQSRVKAEKLVDALRAKLTQDETRERQSALEAAETNARLRARLEAAVASENTTKHERQALEQEVQAMRERLTSSQQEAARHQAEAQTLRAMLDRLSLAPTADKPAKKKAG